MLCNLYGNVEGHVDLASSVGMTVHVTTRFGVHSPLLVFEATTIIEDPHIFW